MEKRVLKISALLLILIIALNSCSKDEPNNESNEPVNSPPTIQNLTSSPNTSSSNRLPAGEQLTVSLTATDPDKDNLSYTWEADGGAFEGQTNQSSVTWKSPISTSLNTYKITGTVSDGADTDSESLSVYVDKVEEIQTAKVTGKVYYASTTIPVSGVMISISDKTATTGSDGYYEIADAPQGIQTITATKDGYDTYSSNIEVLEENNYHLIDITSALYTFNLFGIILDDLTNEPIPYVDVVVLNPNGSESDLKTQSSSTGYYQIPTVPQGERTVRFKHSQYKQEEIDIFMANSDYELNFDLESCQAIVTTGNYEFISPHHIKIKGNLVSLACDDNSIGHCWATNSEPTYYDNRKSHGYVNSPTEFESEITNLEENTTYYFRSYSWNNGYGISYGNEVVVTTPSFPNCGTIEHEGQTYETVTIGNQCWMKDNLNIYTDGGSWYYNNDPTNGETYGRLYSRSTMMNGEQGNNNVPSGVQGLCPDGWHIPSQAEWQILIDNIGGTSYGGKLKEPGTMHWEYPNADASNISGFTGLPSGQRQYTGYFYEMGKFARFWTCTMYAGNGYVVRLGYNDSEVVNYQAGVSGSNNAYSVRCVKD